MKKVLSQEEIDALIRAARPGAKAAAPRVEQPAVVPWDGRLAGQVGQEHMLAINRLHQAFARNLTHALGAYLRIQFEAALVSGEYLSYGEFLQSIPEVTYLASCKLMPVGVSVLLQLDLAVAYPLIDVLLGGEGKGEAPARGVTEIEEQILETGDAHYLPRAAVRMASAIPRSSIREPTAPRAAWAIDADGRKNPSTQL
jgi:flagellar motor switch protein FliM